MKHTELPWMMKRILIVNLGGMGDLLLSFPALKALRKLFPQAELSLLVAKKNYELAESLSYFNEVFYIYVGYRGVIAPRDLLKNLRILLLLRKKRFDLAVNMRTLFSKMGTRKIKIIFDIINPKIKAGRDTQARGYFFDIRIPENDLGQKCEMDYDIDTVKTLGAEVSDKTIDFEVGQESIKKVKMILEKEGINNSDILIGIHPGGMPSRRWPIINFSKAINEIHKKMPYRFVITGGKDEVDLVKNLVKITDVGLINIAGKLSIKELGALIKRCSLFISNDTGPMHLAAILKTPLVAILGPGDIKRYDPRNISDTVIVLYRKVKCSPCGKRYCKDLRCLKQISPDEVARAVFELLNRRD